MTGDSKAATKKVKAKSEHQPSKKSTVKKTKKVDEDEDGPTNGSKKSSGTKKSGGATRSTSLPPKPASAMNLSDVDTPASSGTWSASEPSDHPTSSRRLVKPTSTRNGLQGQGPKSNTNGSANPGRSSRDLGNGGRGGPNGQGRAGPGRGRDGPGRGREGRGRGRGRSLPSSRGVARNMSYDGPPSQVPGGRGISAPRRPQSMRALPGVPPEPLPTRKPQSMVGLAGASGRANFGRGLKVMGKNAISNRNLPPPPGSRSRSKRNVMGSSHHRSARSLYSDDDDDDNEEFATDLAEESGHNRNVARKPESILRRGQRPTARRMNADGSISLSLSAHSTNFSIDEDEEFHESDPMIDRTPSLERPTLKMSRPGLGAKDSDQSMRGWTQSFKWGNNDRRGMMSDYSASKSMRSLLTIDLEFEDEPRWKQILRYLRILAPHPDEKPIKRNIRYLIWLSLILDFMTGVVSIVNYDDVTYCCGQPILNIAGDINWHLAIQIVIYLYMVLIFMEIIPVLREGFPFNLFNPFVGFLITFAMFFDDRISQAVTMWVIEASAVLCEFLVYRLKVRWHNQRQERLEKTERDLVALRKERKRRRLSASTHSFDSVSSGLSLDDKSFHDESGGGSSEDLARPKDVSQIRETRLLRERRILRQAQSEHTRALRYELGGVSFNIGLVIISLMLIVVIAKSGGLCIVDMETPNIFKGGQISMCFKCMGTDGECEVCGDDGSSHCYYPYY